MASKQLDTATFVAIAGFCAYDFWKFRQAPEVVARPVRLKAAGILLYASIFLQRAFLRSAGAPMEFGALLVAVVGGGTLFYLGTRRE